MVKPTKRGSRRRVSPSGRRWTDQEEENESCRIKEACEKNRLEARERQARELLERDADERLNPPGPDTVFVCDTRYGYEGGGWDVCVFTTRAAAEAYALDTLGPPRADITTKGVGRGGDISIAITKVVLNARPASAVY